MPILKIEIPQPIDAKSEELASGVREVLLSAGVPIGSDGDLLYLTEVQVSVQAEQEQPA